MTTIAEALVAVLEVDTTLTAILTGGIYTIDEAGRNGISSASIPTAYDASGILKPTATIYYRGDNPWGGGHDIAKKYDSMRGIAEVRLYDDGDRRYSTSLDSASNRVEALLHNEHIVNAGALKRLTKYEDREPDMENALLVLIEFQVVFSRQLVS